MAGFELRITGVRCDHSTTAPQQLPSFLVIVTAPLLRVYHHLAHHSLALIVMTLSC